MSFDEPGADLCTCTRIVSQIPKPHLRFKNKREREPSKTALKKVHKSDIKSVVYYLCIDNTMHI